MTRSVADIDELRREPPAPGGGTIEARYGVAGRRTVATRIREQGSLRIRQPRGATCQSILVNTAGGIVGGDRLSLGVSLDPHSDVTVTSAAAEKIYRGVEGGPESVLHARFTLSDESRLLWIPQETIVFDAARLRRGFAADIAESSELVVAELLVFGRPAYGETDIHGVLYDSWRVRRGGRLVFADKTRLDGAIGRRLARAAVAGGCPAVALLLVASPRAPALLDPARGALARALGTPTDASAGGATLKDGIIVARILGTSAERLRAIVAATLQAIGVAIPRVWQ